MAKNNEPLRENETGAFGELAKRPNPDNLVILPVPAVEDMLPFLQQRLGRELTAEDIELQAPQKHLQLLSTNLPLRKSEPFGRPEQDQRSRMWHRARTVLLP